MVTLDICNYSNQSVCRLYTSDSYVSGQAHDITLTIERNGWKTLQFSIPSTIESESGSQDHNYRIDYIKADYLLRLHDDDGDIDGDTDDYFLISGPKIIHENYSNSVTVNAGHISQLLKTKNLSLVFSDTEGNNIGTAKALLDTVLEGTGWKAGEVDTFYETIRRDSNGQLIEKQRTLVASDKTGAFALITKICDLFEARAIFHGATKTVDLLPMNPFSEPTDGGLPDVAKANGVFELHYGKNIKSISKQTNTDSIVTRLYVYGAYGDATTGYCGIEEIVHNEWYMTYQNATAGRECKFTATDPMKVSRTRYFTPTRDIAGSIIWSDYDPASMMYVWDEGNQIAYKVYEKQQSTSTPIPTSSISCKEVENHASFLMDFSYYDEVGLFTDEHLQELAQYQRTIDTYLERSTEAATVLADKLGELSRYIGSVDFVKLKVTGVQSDSGHTRINFDGIEYTSQYSIKEKNRFTWRPTKGLKANGDSQNEEASVIYIVRNAYPLTFEKYYFLSGSKDEGYITLADDYVANYFNKNSQVFLFSSNNVNGYLGALESQDEAAAENLVNSTKIITKEHPTIFSYSTPSTSGLPTTAGWYGWWWQYGPYSTADYTATQNLYFRLVGVNSNRWMPVSWGMELPAESPVNTFFYNWKTGLAYYGSNSGWVPLDSNGAFTSAGYDGSSDLRISESFGPVLHACLTRDQYYKGQYQKYTYTVQTGSLPAGNYAFKSPYGMFWLFSTNRTMPMGSQLVYDTTERQVTEVTKDVQDDAVEVKHYNFDSLFYHPSNAAADVAIEHNMTLDPTTGGDRTEAGWHTTQTVKVYPNLEYETDMIGALVCFYNEKYNFISSTTLTNTQKFVTPANTKFLRLATQLDLNNAIPMIRMSYADNAVIADDETYKVITLTNADGSGELKGILNYIDLFSKAANEAYGTLYTALTEAQNAVTEKQDRLVELMGPMFREGWLQKNDYIDGDEYKLYDDALDTLHKIAYPEETFSIGFLDYRNAYLDSVDSKLPQYQHISTRSAAHIIDVDTDISQWAFLDKVVRCFDQPWKTQIVINTNLTTMSQHSFADVMQHIAEVANTMSGKDILYGRTMYIGQYGKILAETIEGQLDTDRAKITGASSTMYTDDRGNLVFEMIDGSSAMMITGAGFCLASSKNEDGDWNWRAFGTGEGFSADMLTSGHIRANLIEAGSIVTSMLAAPVGEELNLQSNASVRIVANSAVADAGYSNLLRCATSEPQTIMSNNYLINTVELDDVPAGVKQMTFRVFIETGSAEAKAMLMVDGSTAYYSNPISTWSSGWATVTIPIDSSNSYVSAHINGPSGTNRVIFHSPKLEYGAIPTPFSTCPDDLEDMTRTLERATFEVNPKYVSTNLRTDTSYGASNLYSELFDGVSASAGSTLKNGLHGFTSTSTSTSVCAVTITSSGNNTGNYAVSFNARPNKMITLTVTMGDVTRNIYLEQDVTTRVVMPFVGVKLSPITLRTSACTLIISQFMVEGGLAASGWCKSNRDEVQSGVNMLSNGGFEYYFNEGALDTGASWYIQTMDISPQIYAHVYSRLLDPISFAENSSYLDNTVNTGVLDITGTLGANKAVGLYHTPLTLQANDYYSFSCYLAALNLNANALVTLRIYPLRDENIDVNQAIVEIRSITSKYPYDDSTGTYPAISTEDRDYLAPYVQTIFNTFSDLSRTLNGVADYIAVADGAEAKYMTPSSTTPEYTESFLPSSLTGGNTLDKYYRVECRFKTTCTRHLLWFDVASTTSMKDPKLFVAQCKLEHGLNITPYSVCPADNDHILNGLYDLNANTSEQLGQAIRRITEVEQLVTTDSIVNRIIETTQFSNEADKIRESAVSQTLESFNLTFETTAKTLDNIQSDLAWFDFSRDGELRIGKSSSSFITSITPGKLSYIQNGSEVAYLSDQKLYITQAEISNQLRLGKLVAQVSSDQSVVNFAWEG